MKQQLRKLLVRTKHVFSSIGGFVKGSVHELKLVTWPTRVEVTQYTVLTIVTIGISIAIITGLDYGLQALSQRFLIR